MNLVSDAFPIHAVLPEIQALLTAHARLVVEAPPGAGKTTQIPLALLAAPWLGGKIVLLEPRRIAAKSATQFMAEQLGESVGETIGYRIRHETRVSAATRVEVVTEAILTRMLQEDPALEGVGALIFDEFHERHLHTDLGLALALDAQKALRPDLRLIVMSASMAGERVSAFLEAPLVSSQGKSYPVDIRYLPPKAQETPLQQIKRGVLQAWQDSEGDILVFLPGKREIAATKTLMQNSADIAASYHALHGELDIDEQKAIVQKRTGHKRRVILATNVAESSITIPGIAAVVDTGLQRTPTFDPNSGFSRLATTRISQASATQRAGRAGRTAHGICYRLWSSTLRLDPFIKPELQQTDLAGLVLELAAWGSEALDWLDPLPEGAIAQAKDALRRLGALGSDAKITSHGRKLHRFVAQPRLANAILAAPPKLQPLACDVAALLEGRPPRDAATSDSFHARYLGLLAFRKRRTSLTAAWQVVAKNADQLLRQLHQRPDAVEHDAYAIGLIVALAFPDRIAKRDSANPARYQLANGRGASLAADSALFGAPWLAIAEIAFDERDSKIRSAAPLDEAQLRAHFPHAFRREHVLALDPGAVAVECAAADYFDRILLEKKPVKPDQTQIEQAQQLLLRAIAEKGVGILPWTEKSRQWRQRVLFLAKHCPELDFPAVDDAYLAESLESWLAPYVSGKSRLSAIAAETLFEALSALLNYDRRKDLETHAPESIVVPSGNRRGLIYDADGAPVLAVKLQELFGLAETPRIAKGRVPLLLHLLSPAQRPIQVTQDLKSFWENTYPEVKKELKGRYPKHPWPDDPWRAMPTARTKKRADP